MSDSPEHLDALAELEAKVEGLRASTFSSPNPSDRALAELMGAEEQLAGLEAEFVAQVREIAKANEAKKEQVQKAKGRMLGAKTTGLVASTTVRLDPVPTGIYNLLVPDTHPLATVHIQNVSRETKRVLVRAYIEGLSTTSARTVEIEARHSEEIYMHPTLLPEQIKHITVIQKATLHVIVEDLDGAVESHNTYHVTMLGRTTAYSSVLNERTGQWIDLSMYYAAWVTPHVDAVRKVVRQAEDFLEKTDDIGSLGMTSYQGGEEKVTAQVKAIFEALKDVEFSYVNSLNNTQARTSKLQGHNTRLPRESLDQRSVNCIDATVLWASLLEAISLNPAIVTFPGHALVAWEASDNSNDWRMLEGTGISFLDFEASCTAGKKNYEYYENRVPQKTKVMPLKELRKQGIWPME